MTTGETLEWIAAAALVVACFLYLGAPLALLALALGLAYHARGYATSKPHPVQRTLRFIARWSANRQQRKAWPVNRIAQAIDNVGKKLTSS